MILIIGALASGKLDYARSLGFSDDEIADAALDERPVLNNLQDLVFADPPYEDLEAPQKVLAALGNARGLLAADALVTIQHSRRVAIPSESGCLVLRSERVYGETTLSSYELGAE